MRSIVTGNRAHNSAPKSTTFNGTLNPDTPYYRPLTRSKQPQKSVSYPTAHTGARPRQQASFKSRKLCLRSQRTTLISRRPNWVVQDLCQMGKKFVKSESGIRKRMILPNRYDILGLVDKNFGFIRMRVVCQDSARYHDER